MSESGNSPAEDERLERASAMVSRALRRTVQSQAVLARRAGVDTGTVSDFLTGQRWPRAGTRSKLEKALYLPPGSIEAVYEGTLDQDSAISDAVYQFQQARNKRLQEHKELVAAGEVPQRPLPQRVNRSLSVEIPREMLEGLNEQEIDEVRTAARLAAMSTARQIRQAQQATQSSQSLAARSGLPAGRGPRQAQDEQAEGPDYLPPDE